MTIFQDSTRLNQDFSGHFSAAGTLSCSGHIILKDMSISSVIYFSNVKESEINLLTVPFLLSCNSDRVFG